MTYRYDCFRFLVADNYIRTIYVAGYVPRSPFKFGKTYREECDICLAEFLGGQDLQRQRQLDITRSLTRSTPGLSSAAAAALADDARVCDRLNGFRDRSFLSASGAARQCFAFYL